MLHAQPHLSKRGQTYQWRRKIRSQSTGICDLQVSLRTRDREKAIIIARKLTAESDKVFEAIERNYLTKTEARAWLSQVAQAEMAKLEKLQLIQKMDGGYDDEDRRLDWAHRKAWRLLADRGVDATIDAELRLKLEAEGASCADLECLENTLDLLSRNLLSEAVSNRHRRKFLELTGRSTIGAYETLQLRQLTAAAKAAAWERFSAAPPQPAQDMAAEIVEGLGSMLFASPVDAPEGAGPVHAPRDEDIARPEPEISRSIEEGEAPDPAEAGHRYDPDIFAVIERMSAAKRKEGIEAKTLRQYVTFGRLFVTLTGKRDLTKIQKGDAARFRELLYKVPKSWGKSSKDANATLKQLLDRSASLPPEKVGLAIGTLNRHIDHLQQVVTWAQEEGIKVDPALQPSKLRRRETERANQRRDKFTLEQLRKLFTSPIWTGSKSEYHQLRPGSEIYRNGIFWVPLICAYSGLRRAEISGLPTAAIKEDNGIAYFDIDFTEERRIKTKASRRRVPIHSRLIELGLLEHVEAQRKAGERFLFPDLYDETLKVFGRDVSRRMRQIIDQTIGPEEGKKLSLHSMKHYVQNILSRDTTVPEVVVREIVAHEGKDVHETDYEKGSEIELLQYAIERLPVVY